MLDIFNNDAFSTVRLTAVVNDMDHVPGRAGELAFVGAAAGVNTTTVAIESRGDSLALIQTSERGAPAPQRVIDKRTLRDIRVPHIKKEQTIRADQVQNIRAFGSEDALQGVEIVVNEQMQKLIRDHDLTLEHHRLGALRGKILDADGATLVDLFSEFSVSQEAEVNFALGTDSTDVRGKCAEVIRKMKRNLKMALPSGARVHALCSDGFFDALLDHPKVRGVWDGWQSAERRLGDSYVHGIFEFGGIFFENYQGTDDNSTVAIAANKAQFVWSGVPGLYSESYAPADFMEAVNSVGLPRYAKIGPDPSGFNRFVTLHTQQNPLPLCLRPKTLMVGRKS